MAKFLEFGADVAEIVNFAVKDQPITRLPVVHGLVPGGGQVEYGKTARAESYAGDPGQRPVEAVPCLRRSARDGQGPACPLWKGTTSL